MLFLVKNTILGTFYSFGQFLKRVLCYLFTLVALQLHAKFQKFSLEKFWDQLHESKHLDKGDIIEPIALDGWKFYEVKLMKTLESKNYQQYYIQNSKSEKY